MNIGKLPSSSIIDNRRSESGSDVTCVEEHADGDDHLPHGNLDGEDNGDDEEGQTFYSVASDQSSSPEISARTQVKFLEKENSNQLSDSPTSASSLNTSSSALSSYDNSPQNPGLLYSFLFPGVVRRKSSCKEGKKRRSSSHRKVSINDKPETLFLDQESRRMSQESLDPETDVNHETKLESAGTNSKMSSRKTSCSSRKSSLGIHISTPDVSRNEGVDPVPSRMNSESSIGSWRKASTTSIEEKQDCLKIKGQGRRRSETINYEADNEVRH